MMGVMDSPALLVRRSVAFGLIAVVASPLLAAWHHHDVDHDGIHHIEAAHGGHAPTLSETDTRIPGSVLNLQVPAVASGVPDLSARASLAETGFGPAQVGPSPRAPPGTSRSRAPPA
jgi:hypothetical protein